MGLIQKRIYLQVTMNDTREVMFLQYFFTAMLDRKRTD